MKVFHIVLRSNHMGLHCLFYAYVHLKKGGICVLFLYIVIYSLTLIFNASHGYGKNYFLAC